MSHTHHPDNCLNCSHHLEPQDKFCAECGQPANTHARITLPHIGHEIVHVVTHADKGFFYLIKALTLQPGLTIKEYLSGKHKKYYSPFSFFFIVLGLVVFTNSVFKPYESFNQMNSSAAGASTQLLAKKNISEAEKQKISKKLEKLRKIDVRVAKAMHFMNTRTNIVLGISTPFIAFVIFLLYYKRLFYAEQLSIVTFINGYLNLLSVVIFSPLMYLAKGTPWYGMLLFIMMLMHIVYTAIVYHRVLDMRYSFGGYLKAALTSLAGITGWTIVCVIVVTLYIAWGVLY
ncbi:DUF3667 domain-containing protein [Mucilaginibacter limnophilus]|uniref:DUF3667 domain-containing protein n=1 Tax=Mucilaginibacter limnophilus TaxID=1932778 RepID=A0A3S2V8S5_9SPHI|nr:DUF3667 domain-containing protein [Mucilaginibacter limnophilus]RVU01395.1 DUF3667 domain-containing protein [Mucilaginibacter limnophilus]